MLHRCDDGGEKHGEDGFLAGAEAVTPCGFCDRDRRPTGFRIAQREALHHKAGMLNLGCADLPGNNATLHTALAQAISQMGADPAGVALEGTFPSLDAIRVNLTGAVLGRDSGKIANPSGERREFSSRVVEITATPARFETLPINLAIRAEHGVFALGSTDDGACGIALEECSIGAIELSALPADIEDALRALASKAAGAQGAEVRSVQVSFKSDSPHRVSFTAAATAKAMFMTAALTIRGQVEIDDQFNAKLGGLTCTGDGMLANLAAGALRPRLTELETRTFALASFLPENIALMRVDLEAEPALRLRAAFRCERRAKQARIGDENKKA